MNIAETAELCAEDLRNVYINLDNDQLETLKEEILAAKKVYVAAAGRSLLAIRAIAMRFMHIGLTSYVVGDTTTPAFEPEDVLIMASTSGETSGLVLMADKAKQIGGKLMLITASPSSTLAKKADGVVVIPTYSANSDGFKDRTTVLPASSIFEQSVLIVGDALVQNMMQDTNTSNDRKFARHANLE